MRFIAFFRIGAAGKTAASLHSVGNVQIFPLGFLQLVSANDVPDKLAKACFHTVKSEFVGAPLIEELPMAVERRLVRCDAESCRMVGEIVNVCAGESVLTEGIIALLKLRPITYDGMDHACYVPGEKVGNAFRDGAALQ